MKKEEKEATRAGSPEGDRRSTGGDPAGQVRKIVRGSGPDPEVIGCAQRRTFTAGYKVRILEEVDRCQEGEIAALLRREGLYYSHLQAWREQRAQGTLAGLSPKKRGPAQKPIGRDYVKKLEHENERLRKKLAMAEEIIEIQKKVSALLGNQQLEES